nr:LLM class flavin-dependent oxidoreductase [uncultured Rhodopila sp.]
MLGANPATDASGEPRSAIAGDMFHDPFVLLSYLAAVTTRLTFSTGVLIVAQRRTALVAKQAACLDVLSGGRLRLGIGVGWNLVEFTGLNGNFHNRGRRSEEQARVMQALWAQPHVTFKGNITRSRMPGSTPAPPPAASSCGMAGITTTPCRALPNGGTAGCPTPIPPINRPSTYSRSPAG